MNLIHYLHLSCDSGFSLRKQPSYVAYLFLTVVVSLLFSCGGTKNIRPGLRSAASPNESIEVGVARIDITPEGPIRLAGYGERKTESEGVLQRLGAKAMAFGSDAQGPSLLITIDLIGIPWHLTTELGKRLSKKTGLDPGQLVICASHTHGGPEIGTLLNHFAEPLPAEQMAKIAVYQEQLLSNLEKIALEALHNRKPAFIAWGQGQVSFAKNRRVIKDGKWIGFGLAPDGPVDHAMPFLRVTDLNGKLRAVLVNYACHGTTLGALNQVYGDWPGEAQQRIEANHPGATALIAVGCGADLNPLPRHKIEYVAQYGQMIADEVERLLNSSLHPLTVAPVGRFKRIELPYAHVPTVKELLIKSQLKGAEGYHARLSLDRISRGQNIPRSLSYPVQSWVFGDDLAMIFLGGEVVVDYSIRLKKELGSNRLWINAYSNDVPCYIASRRLILEGGYEVESSMYSYDRPSKFAEEVEDLIITAVHDLLPASFKKLPVSN